MLQNKDNIDSSVISISTDMNEDSINRFIEWNTCYRRNLNIFCEDYFDLKLHPFQHDILYHLGVCDNNMIVAARAISKTWTLAVGCCGICILYPKSEVVVVASKIDQAGLIVSEKIAKELIPHSPNLEREIKNISISANKYSVEFWNGSTLIIVPALSSARGLRATMIIFEEFRLIPKNIVDEVIDPMSHPRQVPFMFLDKYKDIKPEETKMCYISSSGYTHEWIADAIKNQITQVVNGKNYSFFAFDWFLAVKHGLKTLQDIERAKTQSDEVSFLIEYCNILYGENANGYFTLEQMRRAQVIKEPFYPIQHSERIKDQECLSYHDRLVNDYGEEIRIITIDIASAGGKSNDATCIHCIRAIPTALGYLREFVYEITYNGLNPMTQVLYMRRIYKDFQADYVVFDLANQGRTFFSMMSADFTDEETGEFYQGWTVIDDNSIHIVSNDTLEDLRSQTLSSNALPILFPIKATDEQNHLIATDFRKQLNNGTIKLLIEELEATNLLNKDKGFRELWSDDKRAFMFAPYRNTSEFITETIQLNAKYQGGKVKLTEPSGARKDRYSSGSYGNYFISIKENEFLKDDRNSAGAQEYFEAKRSIQNNINKKMSRSNYFR